MEDLIKEYRETIQALEDRVNAIRLAQMNHRPGSGHYERCSFRAAILEQEIMEMYRTVREMEDRDGSCSPPKGDRYSDYIRLWELRIRKVPQR